MNKTSKWVVAAVVMLCISVYVPVASAQEQSNNEIKNSVYADATSDKKGAVVERAAEKAPRIISFASHLAKLDERQSEIDLRIAQLEKKTNESESVADWIGSAIEKVIADAVGFAVFAFIIVLSLKRELVKTVNEGLTGIGETFANAFVTTVVPQIESFRNDAISILRDKPFSYMTDADLSAPHYVDKELESATKLIAEGRYHEAEKYLKELSNKYPTELKIVAKLSELYNMAEFAAVSDPTALAKDCVHFLEGKAKAFSNVADFYYILTWAYMKFAGSGKHRYYYKLALDAAGKAKSLEPERPRWYSLLGVVHHCFGVVSEAIEVTETALKLAQEQSDKESVARAKNNLAYYYAKDGRSSMRDTAITYAREACEYDKEVKMKESVSLDTLGFVLMSYGETSEELEEAVDVLNRAVKLDPKDTVLLETLTEAQKRLKSFSTADC